ncbi:hypothetical protein J2T13_004015 [Paenibacillus sp. DS2015]|uniref:hypothetical protein n=1 Tax=Paenibacillus sp. DS2015 TaxID=3373917 RepID=UPI003D1E4F3D
MKKLFISFLACFMLITFTQTLTSEAKSEKVSLKLSNGATYYGEVNNGKPHGKGTMTWSKSKTYSGEWVTGKRSGYGKYITTEKDYEYSSMEEGGDPTLIIYMGYWNNDMFNGEGVYRRQVFAPVVYGFQYKEQKGTFKNNKFVKGYEKEAWATGMNLNYTDGATQFSIHAGLDSWQDNYGANLYEIINKDVYEFTYTKNGKSVEYLSSSASWNKDKSKILEIIKPHNKMFNQMLDSYLTDQGSKYF